MFEECDGVILYTNPLFEGPALELWKRWFAETDANSDSARPLTDNTSNTHPAGPGGPRPESRRRPVVAAGPIPPIHDFEQPDRVGQTRVRVRVRAERIVEVGGAEEIQHVLDHDTGVDDAVRVRAQDADEDADVKDEDEVQEFLNRSLKEFGPNSVVYVRELFLLFFLSFLFVRNAYMVMNMELHYLII